MPDKNEQSYHVLPDIYANHPSSVHCSMPQAIKFYTFTQWDPPIAHSLPCRLQLSPAMGDCLRVGKPSRCKACQLGRFSLLPSMGR